MSGKRNGMPPTSTTPPVAGRSSAGKVLAQMLKPPRVGHWLAAMPVLLNNRVNATGSLMSMNGILNIDNDEYNARMTDALTVVDPPLTDAALAEAAAAT